MKPCDALMIAVVSKHLHYPVSTPQ